MNPNINPIATALLKWCYK